MNNNERLDISPAERRQLLLERIQQYKTMDVKRTARDFCVNEATIRRDLNKLENTGLVKRTYGGAVLVEGLDAEIPLYARENANLDKKDFICRMAADYVKDGDTIILDSSSTTSRMIKFLSGIKNLKIITNGAKTAVLLTKLADATIYCTGGKMRENSLSYIGQTAIDYIRNFYADTVFFSCRSLSERALTDSSDDEAMLRRAMIENSRRSILLIDSTKVGTDSFFNICKADQIDHIISDCCDYMR